MADEERDLGFGSVVSRESRRLLNRDGTFNARRVGLGLGGLAPYHALLTMSWSRFLVFFTVAYFGLNALFAWAYLLCGPGALAGDHSGLADGTFLQAFFFSIQSFATIGFGDILPVGTAANTLVSIESFVSILAIALATGLIFARFSRPRAQIRFSERAVIAPYRGITALEFRIVNERRSELVEVEAKVIFTFLDLRQGTPVRQYHELPLERTRVTFFPLSWTIVHPIDETSPLRQTTLEEMTARSAEFLVIVSGMDEALSQTVHARSSYQASEVVWGRRFRSVFVPPGRDGTVRIDASRLNEMEPAP